MRAFVIIAWRNVWRKWRRSLLTAAVISIGFAALIFIWGISDGVNETMLENYTSNLVSHIQIHKKGFLPDMKIFLALDDPDKLVSGIASMREIEGATERIESNVFLSFGDRTARAILIGVDPSREAVTTSLWKAIRSGRYLEPCDTAAIIVGQAFADRLQVPLGGAISVISQAADGSIGAAKYKLVGVYNTGTGAFEKNYVFTTLAAARDLFSLGNRSTCIAIRTSDRHVAAQLMNKLAGKVDLTKNEISDWWQIVPELRMSYNLREAMVHFLLIMTFLIVAASIFNTILISVIERTAEFGVIMALGTKPRQIVILVLLESLILGLVGVVGGLIVGNSIIALLQRTGLDLTAYIAITQATPAIPSVIYPVLKISRVFFTAALLLIFSLLAAFYPAIYTIRLKPAEAIRQRGTV
jgi:ABC-type lipoprotein release transport system permease subunit